MRKKILVVLVTMVAVLALAGALYAQETDPESVVTASAEVFNAGDIEASMAFWADDAVVYILPSPPHAGAHTGLEEIRAWFEGMIAVNGQIEVEILQVDGDTVTAKSRYWDDNVLALGIEYLEATEEYTVQDGKITAYTWTQTDESLAEFLAAVTALPETGVGPPPTETVPLWLAVGGLLVALGLTLRWASAHARSPR